MRAYERSPPKYVKHQFMGIPVTPLRLLSLCIFWITWSEFYPHCQSSAWVVSWRGPGKRWTFQTWEIYFTTVRTNNLKFAGDYKIFFSKIEKTREIRKDRKGLRIGRKMETIVHSTATEKTPAQFFLRHKTLDVDLPFSVEKLFVVSRYSVIIK